MNGVDKVNNNNVYDIKTKKLIRIENKENQESYSFLSKIFCGLFCFLGIFTYFAFEGWNAIVFPVLLIGIGIAYLKFLPKVFSISFETEEKKEKVTLLKKRYR